MSDDDDDPPSPSCHEPRLKKARHLWQVKGNAQNREASSPCCSRETSSGGESSSSVGYAEGENPCKMMISWRAQHLAKALFDNTVNTMIENMGLPLQEMGNLIDGYANHRTNNNLEDQAVRMAIRSHGLQKSCSCTRLRPLPHIPCYIPFHRRSDSSLFGEPSTSSVSLRQPDFLEQDILSEAVNVAILNKGLGASHGSI